MQFSHVISSSGPPFLIPLFWKPIQEVLVGAVSQHGGSVGDATGPDLEEGRHEWEPKGEDASGVSLSPEHAPNTR